MATRSNLAALLASALAVHAGEIHGTITATNGAPVPDVWVEAWKASWPQVWPTPRGKTDATGNYAVTNLPAGDYNVGTYTTWNYVDEWYREVVRRGTGPLPEATVVSVPSDGSVSSIDFVLQRGGGICGVVEDISGRPIPDIGIRVRYRGAYAGSYARSDSNGWYSISKLPPATNAATLSYAYSTAFFDELDYVDMWYSNAPVYYDSHGAPPSATGIACKPGVVVSNISFRLPPGGRISGRVLDMNGMPLADVTVSCHDSLDFYGGGPVRDGTSGSCGAYTIVGVPPGGFLVRTMSWERDDWYNDVPVPDQFWIQPTNAQTIAVSSGVAVSNVDFHLKINPCFDALTATNGNYTLGVTNTFSGKRYAILATTSLVSGSWHTQVVFTATGDRVLTNAASLGGATEFLRIKRDWPAD